MKKLLWFICIYNLIFIFASFPSYAVVTGGYCHPNGPNGIGINTKNFKPFEKDKIVKIKRAVSLLPIRVIEYNTTYCF